MDRNRENRRGTAPAGNLSSRRRSRSAFRDSSGVSEVEDGVNELHDSLSRLRDRSSNGKTDRSSRRRRVSSNESFRVDRDEIAEGSTDESSNEEQEEEDEPVRSGNLRRTNRVKPQWKGSDEMIGVSVPRKARSASAKRSQESSSVFVMGGGNSIVSDGLLHRQSSSSPVRTSANSVSPPSSNASMKACRRMKPVTMKTKPPKTTKVSISESEVEVAQVLFGLTRLQAHQSPLKPEIFQSSSPKHEFKRQSSNEGSISAVSKASSPTSTPVSPPSSSQPLVLQHSTPIPATTMAPKRKKPRPVKLEDSGSTTLLASSSILPPGSSTTSTSISPNGAAPTTKIEADKDSQATKREVLSPRSERNAGIGDGGSSKLEPSGQISSPLLTAPQKDIQQEEKLGPPSPAESKPPLFLEKQQHLTADSATAENPASDATCQAPGDQISPKELSPSREPTEPLVADNKLEVPKISSPVSAADGDVHRDKLKIDLMALPTNSFLDSDGLPETTENNAVQAADHKPIPVTEESASNDKEIADQAVKMETEETKVEQDPHVPDTGDKIQTKEATEETDLEKRSVNERNSRPHHDENKLDKGGNKQQSQKPKNTSRQVDRTVPPGGVRISTSTPIPVTLPGWPGSLPPFGYMGSSPANLSGVSTLQGALPMEGNSAVPNAPFVMLSPPVRPSRCATHFYIARLIHYQQQLARLNPFWAAAGSATFYGAKQYNPNILPNSDALMLGGSLIRNSTPLPQNGLGSGSIVTLNGHSLKDNLPNSFDAQRKQSHFPQSAQQAAAFVLPVSQSKTGGTKSGSLTENAGLLSACTAAAAGSGSVATANSNFSNLAAATSDPQYLAMLHSNYPFPIPPAYRAHLGQQQQQQQPQPAMAHGLEFIRPFYPSQLLQLQCQSFPQTQNPATSTGSSSSHKRLQAQHCFPLAKPPLDSREPTGNGEDSADSRVSLIQKKFQNSNLSGNQGFNPNFPQNFAIMAATLGGKQQQQQQQQQQPSDPNLHMSLKGIEATAPAPPGHSALQSLPELSRHHYQIPAQPLQLADQLQIPTTKQAKTAGQAPARSSDKSPESSRPQSAAMASAAQQLQKQAMARTKPDSANSNMIPTGAMSYTDRIPAVYSNAVTKYPAGSPSFPNVQSPQWKMPQRMSPAGSPANAAVSAPPLLKAALPGQSGSVASQQTGQATAGSSAGKAAKPASSPLNSSRRATTPGPPVILAQSGQAQNPAKAQLLQQQQHHHQIHAQQLFFPASEPMHQNSGNAAGLYPKRQVGAANVPAQAMFSSSLNQRRPTDQQAQSSRAMTLASAGAYLGGSSKGPAGYNSLAGSSVTVMAASYAQSAPNLPVKSAEQKPAAA